MKENIFIIFLCIIGHILNVDEENSHIYDINYSTEYTVDMNNFAGGQIPIYSNLFFRAKLTPTNNMAVN
jgi:hypothetical protein